MEKSDEKDPDGGGGGGDSTTLTDGDAGYDDYIDRYNEANKLEHESLDESGKPKKAVAPAAPAVSKAAPLGSKTNPVVVPTKRGSQY